ncbi:SufD family Fe-S cluster assembly protein [Candidatus Peribacteria bacterium]|jgi:Fe-S cluster assembly scaffold protein SufB|nr:SufD family Fe-S cluster assembly protein [Candidatus Peribacteria bacterium]MBT4241151.1 SufD family Fe-S cluster assembly protein [Candidatus Peribacteria bacterium]MBT4473873.1 SufD family Fe-S cluster assembly protein [Candidatus Peribacteria bacterium]
MCTNISPTLEIKNGILVIPKGKSFDEPINLELKEDKLKVKVESGAIAEVICNIKSKECEIEVEVEGEAKIHWKNISSGDTANHSVVSHISGDNSESNIDWIFHAKDSSKYNFYAKNIFDSKNCSGNIKVRGVSEDSSYAKFDGMIEVTEKGSGTQAYLSLDSFMLDPTAKIDAVPALEIRNDNVRASHSASVTNINKEDLFYFASRGVDEEEAKKNIVEGFLVY